MPGHAAPVQTPLLPDGRVIINGGEYNFCKANWANQGALYDPVQDSWTSVSPPYGWEEIGDAPSVILASGNYMLADCCDESEAIASISGTNVTWTATGTRKGDTNNEEGWTILPGGDVETVDTYRGVGNGPNYYEIYDAASGSWSTPGKTAQQLVSATGDEIGPAVLRPDGTVIQFGATGHNDLYMTFRPAPGAPLLISRHSTASSFSATTLRPRSCRTATCLCRRALPTRRLRISSSSA